MGGPGEGTVKQISSKQLTFSIRFATFSIRFARFSIGARGLLDKGYDEQKPWPRKIRNGRPPAESLKNKIRNDPSENLNFLNEIS